MDGTTRAILNRIASIGFATSVHKLGEYVEMHAVSVADTTQVHITRDGDGDDDDALYRAAVELANSVGLDLEDG